MEKTAFFGAFGPRFRVACPRPNAKGPFPPFHYGTRLQNRKTGTTLRSSVSNRSYLPITKFSIEQSDGVTAISSYLQKTNHQRVRRQASIEVIPNFVNCDLYTRKPMNRCVRAGRQAASRL